MAARSYTIGQVSRLTGLPVRRLRFYADKGLLPPADRTESGYRLFSDEDIVRIDLIRALREAGLGLPAIRDVLARKLTLKDVLALRLREIEAQIASQNRIASALRAAIATPMPDNDDLRRIWIMTNLSHSERAMAVEQFFTQVTTDPRIDPEWGKWMTHMSLPAMPETPSGEQLDAWLELSAMIADPAFIEQMRAHGLDADMRLDFRLFRDMQAPIAARAIEAISEGAEPASAQGAAIADAYLEGWAKALGTEVDDDFLARMYRKHALHKPALKRYWQLVGIVGGRAGSHEQSAEWLWIDTAAILRLEERMGTAQTH